MFGGFYVASCGISRAATAQVRVGAGQAVCVPSRLLVKAGLFPPAHFLLLHIATMFRKVEYRGENADCLVVLISSGVDINRFTVSSKLFLKEVCALP